MLSPKSDPKPLGVPLDVVFAFVGMFDKKRASFWDQKKMFFSGCALGPSEVLNRIFLAHFVAILDQSM